MRNHMENLHGLKLGDDISTAKIKTMVKRRHVDFSLYFDIKYETRKDQAICLLCEKVISRYGYGSNSSMLNHMKTHGIKIGEENSEISYSAVRGHAQKLVSSDSYDNSDGKQENDAEGDDTTEILENEKNVIKNEIEKANEGIIKKKYKKPTIQKFLPFFDINRETGKARCLSCKKYLKFSNFVMRRHLDVKHQVTIDGYSPLVKQNFWREKERYLTKTEKEDIVKAQEEITQLNCFHCSMTLPTKIELDEHMKNVHEYITCCLCEKSFAKLAALRTHLTTMHEEHKCEKCFKTYKCEQCGKIYERKYEFDRHVDLVHKGLKYYYCEECGKGFTTKFYVGEHKKVVHLGQKNFPCTLCEKSFAHKTSMQIHIRAVHEKRMDYSCETCKYFIFLNTYVIIFLGSNHLLH